MRLLLRCAPVVALTFAALGCTGGPPRFDVQAPRDATQEASDDATESDVPVTTFDISRDIPPISVDAEQPDGTVPVGDACAATRVMGTVERLPVDIIWVVDNSASMQPAIDQVTAGLNSFAATVGTRGLDYRVVMLSLRSRTNPVTVGGSMRYGVCIPQPLAGDDACGNSARFFHSSIDIRSTQPLEQFLGTLGQTPGYRDGEQRGGAAWRDFLRPDATKTIVVVTDDNSRLSATQFERFAGGMNPFNSLTLPPGILDASWGGLFDNYTFSGIYGYGSDTDASARCMFTDGSQPASAGPTYTSLVTSTMGVRAQICAGASAWGPFFESVATAVVRTSRIACDLAIPPPPAGELLDYARVNVVLAGSTPVTLGKVRDEAACGPSGGWYYDNNSAPTRINLCPASCTEAQTRQRMGGAGIEVLYGCESIPG